ncbi:hypothetical protein COX64_02410, partial [Candidatus Dojkabacteria bacterium CG_4_10_14_0_2_um_filter_Dojkabacteria_WS6_41_15]
MAGGKKEVSMSALGHFYDAVFANTQEQVKKYGREGASDYVGAEISDGMADAIVDVAATLTLSPQLADQFQANAVNYFNDKLTGGFGLNLTDIGILTDPKYTSKTTWATAARDEYGNVIGSNEEITVAPKIEIKNLNDLVSDPKGVADAAADAFFTNWKAAMNARAIAGVGNYVQEAANMRQLRDIGIDPDICATVAHARIGTEKNFGAGPVGVSSGESVRNEVLANTFAMYGGAMTATERKDLSSHLLKQADAADPTSGVFENAMLRARAQATAAGANFAYWNGADPTQGPEGFTDLFTAQKNSVAGFKHAKTNILGQFDQATLFNPNPFGAVNTTEGYGLFLKNSLQGAIQDSLSQPAVLANPSLRTNLMKLFSSLDDETKATNFFKELGNAGAGDFRDMSGAVKAGIDNLGAEFARHGNVVGAARMASASGTVGANNGEMKLGDWLSYMSYRNGKNGFFGTSGIAMNMLVFGDAGATKAFIDGVGALNIFNPLKPSAGSIEPMVNGSYFMNYLAEKDLGFQLFSSAESKQFSKYYFGYTNAKGESEDKKRLLGWKQLGWTIGPNASWMQKQAYKFHTYHPYSFVTGLLTGETPQRMIRIGTDHGRFITQPARWSKGAKWAERLMKNKSYQTVMRISAKVQGIMAIPGRIVRDATQKVAKIVLEKVIMKVAVKLGMQAVVHATAALLTAGVTEVIYWTYVVLNWLSGGFLDKVVK